MTINYQQILIPVDGSTCAKLALARAIKIAKPDRAELHLVHVINTPFLLGTAKLGKATVNQITGRVKKKLDNLQKIAQRSGLETDYSIEYGSPRSIIASHVTKRWHVDLIVMGINDNRAPSQRNVVGSIANYVLQMAPCDTLIVKSKNS